MLIDASDRLMVEIWQNE